MKTQQETNAEWTRTVPSNIGPIGILVPPQSNSGLRRPYHYERSIGECRSLEMDLKSIMSGFKQKLQCALLDLKAVKYGRRVQIFALGYRPGLCGDEHVGITDDQWQEFAGAIASRLRQSLGDEVSVYVEPWSDTKKFQLRFETYILYA